MELEQFLVVLLINIVAAFVVFVGFAPIAVYASPEEKFWAGLFIPLAINIVISLFFASISKTPAYQYTGLIAFSVTYITLWYASK